MTFRKLKKISVHGNSPTNLVLRQRWAIELLRNVKKKTVLLAIDETWLGMSDFRRMKWRGKGTTNSVPTLQLQPRISMLVAIATQG